VRDGIPLLVRHDEAAALTTFSQAYADQRRREGWPSMTAEQARALPYRSPQGCPVLYWEVRRQTCATLLRFLSEEGPPPEKGPVADLGAGTGWLAYRLSQVGYRALALDAGLDRDFGLGAAQHYKDAAFSEFLPVQGDLLHLPIQQDRLSLAILNASLHYVRDLRATIGSVAETLQAHGRIIILDTPISKQPWSGSGLGSRHLGQNELKDALAGAGMGVRWIPVARGLRWWIYQVKNRLKSGTRFSFPMVVGYRKKPN
jgi:SAM-dependent methyltransferase